MVLYQLMIKLSKIYKWGCTTNLTNGEFCLETIQSEEALQIYNILKDRMLSGRWSIKSYKEN